VRCFFGSILAAISPFTSTLLVGAALALWLRGPITNLATVRRVAYALVLGGPPLLVAGTWLNYAHNVSPLANPFVCTFGYTLLALTGAGILLLTINPQGRMADLLSFRPLVDIGRISYGLYIYHGLLAPYIFAFSAVFRRHDVGFLMPVAGFAGTYALAKLSFRFVEAPFLRLKTRFAPRRGAIDDPPPDSGPVILPLGGSEVG